MTTGRKIGRRGKTLYYIFRHPFGDKNFLFGDYFINSHNLFPCSLLGFKGFRQITTVVGISSHFNNYAWNKAAETPTPRRNKRRSKTASSCPYDIPSSALTIRRKYP